MRAAALAALLFAGCAEAQDNAPETPVIATVPAEDLRVDKRPGVYADADTSSAKADAWLEQAQEMTRADHEWNVGQLEANGASAEQIALVNYDYETQRERLLKIHALMVDGLSHSEATMRVTAESAGPDPKRRALDLAANPDPDPLNPGYSWRGDFENISRRYGFSEPFYKMQAPDWVQFVGEAPVSPESGGLRAERPFCWGRPVQGGLVACALSQNAVATVGGKAHEAYKDGVVVIGFDRDAPRKVHAHIGQTIHNWSGDIAFTVEPREWDVSRIDGLPKNMVSEYTEEELARIRAATARKKKGFASDIDTLGFADGFISPIQGDYVKTTNFGAQRILNGEPKRPHYGMDMAAPLGTPIVAPADGIVSLADEDMYFEGSLVMIDHGQGLISYYLHNEDVLVEEGQVVRQGEQIATVGLRGRSTGPHLCWRLKWHGQNLDPELLLDWPTHG